MGTKIRKGSYKLRNGRNNITVKKYLVSNHDCGPLGCNAFLIACRLNITGVVRTILYRAVKKNKASPICEEFLLLMWAKGYERKSETFGEDAPRFISFRPLGNDRFVRGCVKSPGREYTKEQMPHQNFGPDSPPL